MNMSALLLGAPIALGIGIYTYRAGRMYWADGLIRAAVGTWALALASIVVPGWYLWSGR